MWHLATGAQATKGEIGVTIDQPGEEGKVPVSCLKGHGAP